LDIQGDNPDPRICSIDYILIPDKRKIELKKATADDEQSQTIIKYILQGWPESKDKVAENVKCFFDIKDTLAYEEDLIFKAERVFIPKILRNNIKKLLHASHNGVDTMLRRARETVYWPGMLNDLKVFADNCRSCQELKPANQKEPLIQHDTAKRPWQKIGCDLFEIEGRDYLIVVDYCTNFIEVDLMNPPTSQKVVNTLEKLCARYGIPQTIVSDNGSQFTSREFKRFTDEWIIEHQLSSPYHQQANGKAESSVKIIKSMMIKCIKEGENMNLALLEQRNMPRYESKSPAEMMFGRKLATQIPSKLDQIHIDHSKKINRQKIVEQCYNKRSKELPKLEAEQGVLWKNGNVERLWKFGKVIKPLDDRSYLIQSDTGKTFTRNRIDLRPTRIPFTLDTEPESVLPFEDQPTPDLVTQTTDNKVTNNLETPDGGTSTGDTHIRRPVREKRLPKHLQDYELK
jgi:transposase InsO family protein